MLIVVERGDHHICSGIKSDNLKKKTMRDKLQLLSKFVCFQDPWKPGI